MSKFVTINKWGNSLGIRIPGYIVANLDLEPGDQAELRYHGNRIMIEVELKTKSVQRKTPAEEFDEELRRQLHEWGVPGY